MCGIAGIVAKEAGRFRPELEKMISVLRHRGPDGEGCHFFRNCALGHTRLAVIDPHGSVQPMLAPNRLHGLVFNGEIYGYKQIRAELNNYAFKTAGDTEVLLALYAEYQMEMLSRLPGMFAFAIWDDARQLLFCARDRFGEKPLYYATGSGGEFIFASEIKAIISSGLVEPILNKTSLGHYLKRGYVHPHHCIYSNIHCLPPAHQLVFQNGRVQVSRYWSIPPLRDKIGVEEAAGEFKRLLSQAVARQLVADVPVGTFLSGGLDSSTLVALAAQHQSRVKTFSFKYGEVIDELPYARAVAAKYQTEHNELTDDVDLGECLLTMQDVMDEPHADSANIPTYLLSRHARRQVTVALAGEGADELLAGYDFWYRSLYYLQCAMEEPVATWFVRVQYGIRKTLGLPVPATISGWMEGHCLRHFYKDVLQAHYARNAYFDDGALNEFGLQAISMPVQVNDGSLPPDLNEVLRCDLQDYLPGDILVKTDRASMAHSLEIRCPFLDVDFASFCISLPSRLKINGVTDKIVLRRAFAGDWPETIRNRPKQGFGAPVAVWMQRPSVQELVRTYLANPKSKIFSLLPFEAVQRHQARTPQTAWLLLNLALWLERHKVTLVG